METTPTAVTRDDVARWWQDCIDRRRSQVETSEWAEGWLDRGPDVEELVLQGLLELQALRFRDGDEEASRLQRWQAELLRYDDDPQAWNRRHLQRMLTGFLERHSVERTRAFGHKLVKWGHLTDQDVEDALRG